MAPNGLAILNDPVARLYPTDDAEMTTNRVRRLHYSTLNYITVFMPSVI